MVVVVIPNKHFMILRVQTLGYVTCELEPRVGSLTSSPPGPLGATGWVRGAQERRKPLGQHHPYPSPPSTQLPSLLGSFWLGGRPGLQ